MAGLFDASRLYEVLKETGLLPEHSDRQAYLSSGVYNYSTNRILAPSKNTDTMSHEMTHAVQRNLLMDAASQIQDKKREGIKISLKEEQFLTAAQKILEKSFGTISQGGYKTTGQGTKIREKQVKDMYKPVEEDDKFDSYRTAPLELQGWGVGDMSTPQVAYDAKERLHLNPTATTEFDILLSMYQSLPKSTRTEFASSRKKEIQQNRKDGNFRENPEWSNYRFEDLTSDPFKRTIK